VNIKLRVLAVAAILVVLAAGVVSCMPAPWDMPGRLFDPGFHFWGFGFLGFPFALLGLAVYFLPTIIGAVRRARGVVGIILLNVFGGWTGIGWVGALIWSLVGATDKK
jgi:hypothetical protein